MTYENTRWATSFHHENVRRDIIEIGADCVLGQEITCSANTIPMFIYSLSTTKFSQMQEKNKKSLAETATIWGKEQRA
jgi:hypothetical protein